MEKIMDAQKMENVQNSYGRCLGNGDLIGSFYESFLASDPKIKEKFVNTDFSQQKKLLRHGLNLMIMFASDSYAGTAGLKRIKDSHDRRHLNIKPELYSLWKRSLLKAIKKHDRSYNEQVEKDWIEVLDKGIDYIKSGY